MSSNEILSLDLDFSSQLKYLAEGAANVIYQIILPPSSPSISADLDPDLETNTESPTTPPPSEISPLQIDPRLQGKLIRLRKNLPAVVPVIDSQKHFDTVIRPLFPSVNLVERTLFRPSQALIRECNQRLGQMEIDGSRPRKRHGVYLDEEELYGTLITDMTCGKGGYYATVEFKPKWLAQSPSAPVGATRCRTCALRAMKSTWTGNMNGGPEHPKSGFCPLSLVSRTSDRVTAAVDIMLGRPTSVNDNHVRQALIDFLLHTPLLQRLKELQINLDPTGVLKADVSEQDFLTAMTIRDCTLFLKV